MMTTALVYGQLITREAVQAARVPGGGFLRDEGALEVYVECARCGQWTRTWVTPHDETVPPMYCDYCEWLFDQEFVE